MKRFAELNHTDSAMILWIKRSSKILKRSSKFWDFFQKKIWMVSLILQNEKKRFLSLRWQIVQ